MCFLKNENVEIRCSRKLVTGVTSVINKVNKAVSNYGRQDPPENIGVDSFEFWTPYRRPDCQNMAFGISPAITAYTASNVTNGYSRPYNKPNSWTASLDDTSPSIRFKWDEAVTINEVILMLDTDFDHPMESSLHGHPESVIPFCVRNYEVKRCKSTSVYSQKENHQTINKIKLDEPLVTSELILEFENPGSHVPASVFEVLIY
jgi:hypothetical protein